MKLTTYLAVFVFLLFTALSASSQESAPGTTGQPADGVGLISAQSARLTGSAISAGFAQRAR